MEEIYTLEDFINKGKSSNILKYSDLLFYEKTKNGLLPSYNVLNNYINIIRNDSITVTVSLTDEEYLKYRYKPRLLCYNIYGTQDIYYLILLLNNICNVKEFNMRKIKVIRIKKMEKLLSSIYNAENTYIQNNLNIVKNK